MASPAGRGAPRVHAFPARSCGVRRAGAAREQSAEGRALGQARRSSGRSAADRDAQGLGARGRIRKMETGRYSPRWGNAVSIRRAPNAIPTITVTATPPVRNGLTVSFIDRPTAWLMRARRSRAHDDERSSVAAHELEQRKAGDENRGIRRDCRDAAWRSISSGRPLSPSDRRSRRRVATTPSINRSWKVIRIPAVKAEMTGIAGVILAVPSGQSPGADGRAGDRGFGTTCYHGAIAA